MTPSPENGISSNTIINLNSVERTTEKYSGFYSMGKNIRETKNINKKNRENDNENDDENESRNENEDGNDDDTDDEFEMGILNLSNHDINDDDEVLQGVSYLTPPSKTISMTHAKNIPKNTMKNNFKTSSKIQNKVSKTKGSILLENKSINNQQYKQNYLSLKTVKTPLKRFIIEKREEGSDKKEKYNKDYRLNDDKNAINCAFMEDVKCDEMIEITSQIKALTSELKYFEELTGKRCIFETKVRHTVVRACVRTYIHTQIHTNIRTYIWKNR